MVLTQYNLLRLAQSYLNLVECMSSHSRLVKRCGYNIVRLLEHPLT